MTCFIQHLYFAVVHTFRRNVEDKNLIFRQLPGNMYPEYHKVYQMMQDPTGYEGYKAYEQTNVAAIFPNHCAKLVGPGWEGPIHVSKSI